MPAPLVQLGSAAAAPGLGRRDLLQLVGASLALSAAQGCLRDPPLEMQPYRRQPDDLVPGNPLHYATALPLDGAVAAVLVTAREGRPIKVEGNPEQSESRGATGPLEQAAIYSLYDPDRARACRLRGAPLAWSAMLREIAALAQQHERDEGARLRFLLEPDASPLLAGLCAQVQARFPRARFFAHAAVERDGPLGGAELAFGRRLAVSHDLRRAEVVLALDADFLSPHRGSLGELRDFADRRDPARGPLNRLYAIESTLSLTGICADHRFRVRPEQVGAIALALLSRLRGAGRLSLGPLPAPGPLPVPDAALDAVARDLAAHEGACAVLVGDEQPPEVHALGAALNAALGNLGRTVHLRAPPVAQAGGPAALAPLLAELETGSVHTLVCTAWNPAYSMPADAEFAKRLARVPASVYLGRYEDETAAKATHFLHRAHELESWGDGRSREGTVCLQQPLIAPLFDGLQAAQLLAAWVGAGDSSPRALLEAHWRKGREQEFARFWPEALQRGFIPGSAPQDETAAADPAGVAEAARRVTARSSAQGLALRLMPSPTSYDGRHANNAFLQELPEPVSLVTWDNAAWMSAATLREQGLRDGDRVALQRRGRSATATALLVPGMPDGVVALHLGYGRRGSAETTARDVGDDAYALRTLEAPWFGDGLTLSKTGARHDLAIVQEISRMQDRDAAKTVTVAQLAAQPGPPESLHEARKDEPSLYDQQPVHGPLGGQGYAWGMAVDLSRCTGCAACVMACTAENNVAVVGRAEVRNGRHMHWLRVDRYFTGSEDNPGAIFQPLMCVHCEHAPCEYVCPVNATVHSDEGLNEMVYNRCVGTRYCSNNCPYKVRRFNFYNWWNDTPELRKLASNPDVTVRARGVMEKCSYCVQRIERARISARGEGRRIRSEEVATACQQACPAAAIVFGDLTDNQAQVTRLREDRRAYALLDDLGTRPRTRHLARVRNPNPELA